MSIAVPILLTLVTMCRVAPAIRCYTCGNQSAPCPLPFVGTDTTKALCPSTSKLCRTVTFAIGGYQVRSCSGLIERNGCWWVKYGDWYGLICTCRYDLCNGCGPTKRNLAIFTLSAVGLTLLTR